jgi:DNA-binding PadR family transcriptional regulator
MSRKPRKRRLTDRTIDVVAVLLEEPLKEHYGLEIAKRCGLSAGTIYPILIRLEHEFKWLESRWEEINPEEAGRPARRYYRITPAGAQAARLEVAERVRRITLPSLSPGHP